MIFRTLGLSESSDSSLDKLRLLLDVDSLDNEFFTFGFIVFTKIFDLFLSPFSIFLPLELDVLRIGSKLSLPNKFSNKSRSQNFVRSFHERTPIMTNLNATHCKPLDFFGHGLTVLISESALLNADTVMLRN